jgi:hypothetical protein
MALDVLGLDLETARQLLESQGHRVIRVITARPPGRAAGEGGKQRVARQRWTAEGVELVVVDEMKPHD